jgi:hypothetical protein
MKSFAPRRFKACSAIRFWRSAPVPFALRRTQHEGLIAKPVDELQRAYRVLRALLEPYSFLSDCEWEDSQRAPSRLHNILQSAQ